MPYTLLVGGARSGKSSTAQQMAVAAGKPVSVVATGTGGDQEMIERIDRHRLQRPSGWKTVEEAIDLAGALDAIDADDYVIVDCLTLWVSNLIGASVGDADIFDRANEIAARIADRPGLGVVVTNEVGMGIVPVNELARRYRDVLGSVNAVFAERASRTLLMVAGKAMAMARPADV